jgi:hypothetical protein
LRKICNGTVDIVSLISVRAFHTALMVMLDVSDTATPAADEPPFVAICRSVSQ